MKMKIKELEKEQREQLIKIIISTVLLIIAAVVTKLVKMPQLLKLAFFLVPYAVVGFEVLKESLENILHGEIFDEDFLMSVATIGAFCIGKFSEAVFVMLFFQIGEFFEELAENNSRRSIEKLMDLRPDWAYVERGGAVVKAAPDEVKIGEVIVVRPGERVPLDGKVIAGTTDFDTSALTGESIPREIHTGDDAASGCVNLSGVIKIEVTRGFGDSTVSKILELMENSTENKTRAEGFIARFAKYYTPIVVGCAVLLAFIPPIFAGDLAGWIKRALIFLVVSCPCALVVSVPLSFFSGIGCASKHGMLIKGSNYLEALADAKVAVFDKTGTLTKGKFKVTRVCPNGCSEKVLLEAAAMAESYSDHPIAKSVTEAYDGFIDTSRITDVKETAGFGVGVTVENVRILAGNARLMSENGIEYAETPAFGTVIHVAANKVYLGYVEIADEPKEDTAGAIKMMKTLGVSETVMLTGDREEVARSIAEKCGVDRVCAGLLPDGKVRALEKILQNNRSGKVIYIGDGINDAPSIARADVGIAMGALGSDAAIDAADIVIMDDSLTRIPTVMKISGNTKKIVIENIVFSLAVKAVVMVLGALGTAPLWLAVFADVGVLILAVLNAVRAMNIKV